MTLDLDFFFFFLVTAAGGPESEAAIPWPSTVVVVVASTGVVELSITSISAAGVSWPVAGVSSVPVSWYPEASSVPRQHPQSPLGQSLLDSGHKGLSIQSTKLQR